jgi:radical SAM superfamily enzyme YgiQ (UPF0313 family)
MKALLIYPEFPDTFWSFRYALKFIHRRASSPPLGLLTIAAMLPEAWEKRLVDMNVGSLYEDDLRWADLVFVSAMSVQKESVKEVIQRCKTAGVRIVAGGPLFTTEYEAFGEVDHLVLNEAEITLPRFLEDFEKGDAGHFYTTDQWADIRKTPIPLWGLINMKHYASINIQYSRGCPFNCEFCDITLLCGRTPRTKDKGQIIREIESVYASGFRGQVFFVDDNFIGNKKKKKAFRFRPNYFGAFFRSLVVLGVVGKERFHYWRLLLWTVISRPRLLPQAVTLSIYGFHFRKIFEKRLS